jgi:hypothetical protein
MSRKLIHWLRGHRSQETSKLRFVDQSRSVGR